MKLYKISDKNLLLLVSTLLAIVLLLKAETVLFKQDVTGASVSLVNGEWLIVKDSANVLFQDTTTSTVFSLKVVQYTDSTITLKTTAQSVGTAYAVYR